MAAICTTRVDMLKTATKTDVAGAGAIWRTVALTERVDHKNGA